MNTVLESIRFKDFNNWIKDSNYYINDKFINEFKNVLIKKDEFLKDAYKSNCLFDKENKIFIGLIDSYRTFIQSENIEYKYFIFGTTGRHNISVRIDDTVINAQEIKDKILETIQSFPFSLNAGGHKNAFGITINTDLSIEAFFMLLQSITKCIIELNLLKFDD